MKIFNKNRIKKHSNRNIKIGIPYKRVAYNISNEEIKVSIIIPCFNADKTLSRTLKSIQNSIHDNLEVILVDDGSKDKVDELVKSFNDDRFCYFWKVNEGPGIARNYGIDQATGEYIFFLDSDDEIYSDAISNLLSYAIEENLEVVSGVTVRKSFETGLESEWYRKLYQEKKVNTLNKRLPLYDDALTTNKLYKISTLRCKHIKFPAGLYEDKVFTAQIYSKIDRIGLIPDRVYIWYVYGQSTSISTSKTLLNYKERLAAIYNTWQYLPELRKSYQFSAFFNHDLVIYLREFIYYTPMEKNEIFILAQEFVLKNKHYYYERLLTISLHRGCLDALLMDDFDRFALIADVISTLHHKSLQNKEKI